MKQILDMRQLQLENAKSVPTPVEKKRLAGVISAVYISAAGLLQLDTEKTCTDHG